MTASKKASSHPKSSRVPASLPAVIGRLLSVAAEVRPDASLRQTLERLLDVLVELEDDAAAGVRLLVDGQELTVRRSRADLTDEVAPRRLFPELGEERSVRLTAPVDGTLHFAAAAFEKASRDAYDLLILQAAAILSLVVRVLRPAAASARHSIPPPMDATQLAQLEKLATIGQTASEIVHELNNPLTAIIAYADYLNKRLRDHGISTTDLDRLMRIQEAATRIQRFCRDLTDYSRPSSSLRGAVDVHVVIDRALGFCMHSLRSADITVERVYRDIPLVDGVESSLTQVFVNLFTNAWHAMDGRGGGTLSIRTQLDGSRVLIEVADDGPGIDDEHLARIFDQYFTTKPRGTGVGLGLSIVKQIVRDHGGTVTVENRPASGAAFLIDLPSRS